MENSNSQSKAIATLRAARSHPEPPPRSVPAVPSLTLSPEGAAERPPGAAPRSPRPGPRVPRGRANKRHTPRPWLVPRQGLAGAGEGGAGSGRKKALELREGCVSRAQPAAPSPPPFPRWLSPSAAPAVSLSPRQLEPRTHRAHRSITPCGLGGIAMGKSLLVGLG